MKRLPYFICLFSVIILGVLLPAMSFAQVGQPGCDPFDPACPIDGGLSFLLAAGVGLAARKAFKTSKTSTAAITKSS